MPDEAATVRANPGWGLHFITGLRVLRAAAKQNPSVLFLSFTGQLAALKYARVHFERFKACKLHEIQRLMACLCFARRPNGGPYADLLTPAVWDETAREFVRQCCGLLGLVGNSWASRDTTSPLWNGNLCSTPSTRLQGKARQPYGWQERRADGEQTHGWKCSCTWWS
jgi:CTLH/CRA C-terminal to LisH motif domain